MAKASYLEDELLVCRLGTALGRGPATPPEDRLMELRALVCLRQPEAAADRPRAVSPVRVPRVRSALVGAAFGLTVAGGGAAAFAASALGHGVSSTAVTHAASSPQNTAGETPAVVAAQSAEHALRQDLLAVADQPAPAHAGALNQDALVLANRVSQLSAVERKKLGAGPDELLSLARAASPSVSTASVLPAGRWYVSPASRRPVLNHTTVSATGTAPSQPLVGHTLPGLSTVTMGGARVPTVSSGGSRPNAAGVPTATHTAVVKSTGPPAAKRTTSTSPVKAPSVRVIRGLPTALLVKSGR